ncbi:MAG: ester cyclase [Chitinophagaceae bacterium]
MQPSISSCRGSCGHEQRPAGHLQGDKITRHSVFEGKHPGEFFGIPAMGRSVKLLGSTIGRMQSGLIVKSRISSTTLIS